MFSRMDIYVYVGGGYINAVGTKNCAHTHTHTLVTVPMLAFILRGRLQLKMRNPGDNVNKFGVDTHNNLDKIIGTALSPNMYTMEHLYCIHTWDVLKCGVSSFQDLICTIKHTLGCFNLSLIQGCSTLQGV